MNESARPFTILCFASYEKGRDFLRQARQQGSRLYLLTSLSLKGKRDWPPADVDDCFYMPDEENSWNREHVLFAIAHLAREQRIDRIVPLDEFDQEIAAMVRAHLNLPGLEETVARRFRDKLYMRSTARRSGVLVPDFTSLINDAEVAEFCERVPAPWVLKPRLMAGAIGISKIHSTDELWATLGELGDKRSFHLLESYVPGDVFHVDSIVWDGKVVFRIASAYGQPPLDVSHGGGIFTTSVMERGSQLEQRLVAMNEKVLAALGHTRGVAHTEFILGRADGEVYFLESAARVGGAHIADLVDAAAGINLWAEWARVESSSDASPYVLPEIRHDYSALIVSLARQEWPDTSGYSDPELVWRMNERHHVGLILRSLDMSRVAHLRDDYSRRIQQDFHASLPAAAKPTH